MHCNVVILWVKWGVATNEKELKLTFICFAGFLILICQGRREKFVFEDFKEILTGMRAVTAMGLSLALFVSLVGADFNEELSR